MKTNSCPTFQTKTPAVRCPAHIRIGTRRSALAVAQATEIKNRLLGAFAQLTQEQIELVPMQTTGDRIQDRHLAEIGGKGLFTKEIEDALLEGHIDMAVHSMKDMPAILPDGLVIECVVEREDPRDAFLSHMVSNIEALPRGAVVGTSSLRRQSQLLRIRPDLKIVPFRGNVNTRLAKLERGEVDATLLAMAGLKRLYLADGIRQALSPSEMLPAVAQGAIGVEHAVKNTHIGEILQTINHRESWLRVSVERAFLVELGGSCATPIAGYAEIAGDEVMLRGLVTSSDGLEVYEQQASAPLDQAVEMGKRIGGILFSQARHLL